MELVSKEGEKKEKGCYTLHCWWLSHVQSQSCIFLKQTPPTPQNIHLPFTAFPVIISCLCSLIVSVSYVLVFFKRLNTRGTFISLWLPFIILYFSFLGRIQGGNTLRLGNAKMGLMKWSKWKSFNCLQCPHSMFRKFAKILIEILLLYLKNLILALLREMAIGTYRIWTELKSYSSPCLTVSCFSVLKITTWREILRDRPIWPLCRQPRMWLASQGVQQNLL